jgi:hypothetical protein
MVAFGEGALPSTRKGDAPLTANNFVQVWYFLQ